MTNEVKTAIESAEATQNDDPFADLDMDDEDAERFLANLDAQSGEDQDDDNQEPDDVEIDMQDQKTETTPKTTKQDDHETGDRQCLCGCGGVPSKGREFLPGHDAKLKGFLQRAMRGTEREGDRDLDTLIAIFEEQRGTELEIHDDNPAKSLALAISPKWEKFMIPKPPKRSRKKTYRRKVGRWEYEGRRSGSGEDAEFVYKDKSGDEQRVEWSKTNPVDDED